MPVRAEMGDVSVEEAKSLPPIAMQTSWAEEG